MAGGHAFTWGCAPTVCWTKGFVAFLPFLRSSLLWFCRFLWVLFSHMVHTLRNGATPAWSRLLCPRSERRFSVFSLSLLGCFFVLSLPFGILSPYGSVVLVGSHFCATDGCCWCFALSPGWALNLCLRLILAACHCRSVSCWSSLRTRVRLSLALSSVLPCPMLWFHVVSMTLAPGLRLSLVPYLRSFQMGLEPLSEAPISALQPPAHSFLVVLAEAACLRELLDLSIVLPPPRAQYFVVVGGLACCKDDLGCAR